MGKLQFLTAFLLLSVHFSRAQRSVNLEASFVEPVSGSTWLNGTNVPIVVNVTNHGPDDLVAGDSLFFLPSISTLGIQMVVLDADIKNGTSLVVIDDSLNFKASSTPYTNDFCFVLLDPNTASLQIGDAPIKVSYTELVPQNNSACATLTFVSDTSGTGINDFRGRVASVLNVFPNPASNAFSIPLQLSQPSEVQARLQDITGRLVLSRTFDRLTAGKQEIHLDVSGVPSGLYFISVQTDVHFLSGKVEVEH